MVSQNTFNQLDALITEICIEHLIIVDQPYRSRPRSSFRIEKSARNVAVKLAVDEIDEALG